MYLWKPWPIDRDALRWFTQTLKWQVSCSLREMNRGQQSQRSVKSQTCYLFQRLHVMRLLLYILWHLCHSTAESQGTVRTCKNKQFLPNKIWNKTNQKKALTFYISWYIRIIYLSQLHHELWMTRGWPTPAFFGGATGALSGTCETSSHQWRKNNTSEYRRILHEHTMNFITTSCRISSKLSWMSETQHKDTQSI